MTSHDVTAPKERVNRNSKSHVNKLLLSFACFLFIAMFSSVALLAQAGGEGAVEGTVLDKSGAVVPNATVTATNINTNVQTTQTSTSAGFYSISPLLPGVYTITVEAKGFQTYKQENLTLDAAHVTGLNVHLTNGSATEIVDVTAAPPALETTNATLGGTIENSVYTALPIMISGLQQRDITQFSNLLPGAQVPPGGRSSIIGGTAQRLGELYLDGLPLTTVSQQGDNRPVFNIVPLESIDQIQVVTSGFNAQFQGAGLENYTTKSGGNKYHGAVFEYIRNTAFDAWAFSAKPGGGNVVKTVVNGVLTTVPGPKTPEHQNEYGFDIGGPISIPKLFNGHDKLFFYSTYDKFHSTQGVNFTSSTLPTSLMRKGDFRELCTANAATGCLGNTSGANYAIYDPTTQATCTANNTGGYPCRYQYGYGPGAVPGTNGNPVPTGAPVNVIPASQLSPISQYLEQYLPPPTLDTAGVIQNNYLGGLPAGYDNWLYSGRIDYDISGKNHLNFIVTGGNRHAIPYTATTTNFPVPYLVSTLSVVAGHWAAMEDTYTINPHLVNQFKYGFMNFGGPPIRNPTNGVTQYEIKTAGVTGLPAGQASENFPGVTFGGSNAQGTWATPSTGSTSVSETYEIVDNVQWVKGAHAMTFGFQYQWLENQASTADTGSLPITLPYSPNETDNITTTITNGTPSFSYTSGQGYAYASYLIGAVQTGSVTQQPFSVLGGRFRPFAPYAQDDWKVTPKLTLNLGLRWDYIPTYNEALDRWSFLNPNITNPITGNQGALQFAGTYGGAGVSCGCHSPVNNYLKNWGPRFGLAYSLNDKTVIRAGYALLYTHGGGVGGAGGAATGSGQDGFTSKSSFSEGVAGPQAGPAFYLNSNPAFPGSGNLLGPNANYGGKGATLAPPATIGAITQTFDTGYYVCAGQQNIGCNGTTGGVYLGTTISAPDSYLGGRAPELNFYNFGFQREVYKDYTLTVNYVGSQTHFLVGPGNLRGLQSGQLNPIYLNSALGPYLSKAATAANIAAATAATGVTLPVPYAGYTAAANVSSSVTIAHMLTWMPQFGGTTDTWPAAANSNYNALQVSLAKAISHGLTFNVNYTYSKNIDDAGTARSGWAIPASATSNGKAWAADRIDRSLSINDLPELLTIFGVYQLPFGKGKIGSDHFAVRAVAGGWQLSEIFQYASGLPLAITANCSSTQNVGQGTCMPDFNPNFAPNGSPRINGKWGQGVTAATLGSLKYLQGYVSSAVSGSGTDNSTGAANATGNPSPACAATVGPFCNSQNYTIGNLTRIAPYGLRGPDTYRLTMALSRTFDLSDRFKFIFRADCQNVTNHTTFGNNAQNNQITLNINSSAFGALNFASADSRAFQFSGRITF
jgi:hypothetical protein